jgi:threonine synthase
MPRPFLGYRCALCGAEYAPTAITYICPHHGESGNVDVVLDLATLRRIVTPAQIAASGDESLWRYAPLLPVADPGHWRTPLRSAGWTPLYHADRLARALGLTTLYVKDEGRNPTASFKDRASAVVVARAQEIQAQVITTASTGNAGAALAGMAAAVGQRAVIFAPHTAPPAKVAQLLMFGATVLLVEGNYDQAFDLCSAAAREFGWYCRNTGYNPFTVEGKKTAAFEICEQLHWHVPEAVFVSVGDGNIITGLHKGFQDLLALGWIERLPKLFGAQAAGSAACANAWQTGANTLTPVAAHTLADSISVDLPRDGLRAVRAVRDTQGAFVVVSDDALLAAMRALARDLGVFAEPAGATAYAGLVAAVQKGLVLPDETIVVLNTGNGLKDIRAAQQAAGAATVIAPTLAAARAALAQLPNPPGGV